MEKKVPELQYFEMIAYGRRQGLNVVDYADFKEWLRITRKYDPNAIVTLLKFDDGTVLEL